MILVFDLDGTLSDPKDRVKFLEMKPKDHDAFYAACGGDGIHHDMMHLMMMMEHRFEIVFCTGRREACREDTKQWLDDTKGGYYADLPLLMRPDGDNRSDVDVKPEILQNWLDEKQYGSDEVLAIFEDRSRMVKKWRELGYRCLQVSEGNF